MSDPVKALVAARMGLDVESLGPSVFPRLVAERMRARGMTDRAGYARLLAADPAEWATLAAGLVVPETWFFRGGRSLFDHLAKWVGDRAGRGPVRVLSVPCSTGEEPYSLAIALHYRSVPPAACWIDAIDLDTGSLSRAAAGRYAAFSFREPTPDPRPAAFVLLDDGRWELRPEIRDRVRFRPGNATDPSFLAGEPPYDLILCRNLFIYLTSAARERVAANLDRLLAADGLLCITAAEADRLAGRFASAGPDGFGLFRRTGAATEQARPCRRVPMPKPGFSPSPLRGEGRGGGEGPPPTLTLPLKGGGDKTTEREPPPDPLTAAREQADAGRLDDALTACERITSTAPTAAAFALLGVIQLARGDRDAAAAAFRRALYLDPDHPEALSHMVVLCEQRGDAAQAAALRRRLARVEAEGRP